MLARFPSIDLHALRHTFISRLQGAGVSLVHAQRLAGHSDPKLTAAVYTHVGVEELRGAIDPLPDRAPGSPLDRRSEKNEPAVRRA